MHKKYEAYPYYKILGAMVSTQFSTNTKILRFDSGGEYQDHEFKIYITFCGNLLQSLCLGTPQRSGVSERKNRHSLSISKIINEGFSHAFDFLGRSCIYFRLFNQQVSFFTVR